jgi:hypothetical protein
MVSTSATKAALALKFRHAFGLGCTIAATCTVAQAQPGAAPASANGNLGANDKTNQVAQNSPTKEQCIETHRQAQQAQNEEKLVHARELSRNCTALACPGLIVTDCARWLNDMEQRIPSVVFEVRLDGKPNLTATIVADGERVEEWTRGESLRLDPGEHQFRFEMAEHQPIIQNLLLAEGMRYRIVSVDFATEKPAAPAVANPVAPLPATAPPAAPAERPVPVIVYPLLGVGAVGLGSFALFGLMGKSKQSDLENTCKPNCTDSALKPMKTSYLVGDISLGVGVASLVAASIFYLGRQENPPSTTVGFAPLPGGGAASALYRF